jgi:hypothetical protein
VFFCCSLVAAADWLDLFSATSSVLICCCRHSSLQNGVSPLHAQINQEPRLDATMITGQIVIF